MRILLIVFIPVLSLLSGACSIGSNAVADRSNELTLRLQTDNLSLQQTAKQSLHAAGIATSDNNTFPALKLTEQHTSSVESLAADGSISGYTINYTLTYQYNDGTQQQITRRQVIDHNENRYRAGSNQRRQMVNSLRRSSLTQMIVSLQLQ